jgi:hypothetical protein
MLENGPAEQSMPHDPLTAKKAAVPKIIRKDLLGISQDLITERQIG